MPARNPPPRRAPGRAGPPSGARRGTPRASDRSTSRDGGKSFAPATVGGAAIAGDATTRELRATARNDESIVRATRVARRDRPEAKDATRLGIGPVPASDRPDATTARTLTRGRLGATLRADHDPQAPAATPGRHDHLDPTAATTATRDPRAPALPLPMDAPPVQVVDDRDSRDRRPSLAPRGARSDSRNGPPSRDGWSGPIDVPAS